MSDIKWFINSNDLITGPYSKDEIKSKKMNALSSVENSQSDLVWCKYLTQWIPLKDWDPNQILEGSTFISEKNQKFSSDQSSYQNKSINNSIENSITITTTNSIIKSSEKSSENQTNKLKVQLAGVDQGLFSFPELLEYITHQNNISDIAIFDPAQFIWKDIYQFPVIVDKLGLSRRKTPRVPLLAQFSGQLIRTSSSHETQDFSARVVTVSEGGVGLTDVYDLKLGDTIKGTIASPYFFAGLYIEAEVTYAGTDGYTGLKFTSITDEAQSQIIGYVRKFSKES